MSALVNAFTLLCVAAGIAFYAAGTLGLVRLSDTLSRIHALTKADNLGLALIVLGLLPQAASLLDGAKMVAVWLLAQLASGAVAQVMAEAVMAEAVMAEAVEVGVASAPGDGPT